MSKHTVVHVPDGEYAGSTIGYDVYMDGIDSGFKATTGFKNFRPMECLVVVKDGTAIAYSEGGVQFSDGSTWKEYRKKYGNMRKDPMYKTWKERLENIRKPNY